MTQSPAGPGPALPPWLEPLREAVRRPDVAELVRFRTPLTQTGPTRPAAVLILFGEGPDGADVLLIERASALRSHAGQPAFPGGAVDPEDADAVAAALREAAEETGLQPSGVDVFAVLPALPLPVSSFEVTPVLAWWREPSPVWPRVAAEVAAVHRVPIAELVEPANRARMRYPSGFVGPAFDAAGMTVWGFTAGVLDRLIEVAGWEREWLPARLVDLPTPPVRDEPVVDSPEATG